MNDARHVAANRGIPSSIRWAIFVALSLLALAIRLPQLGSRPMHTDESVNAYITGELLAGETYHYDPRDRHGPLLYAVAEPTVKLLGARSLADLTESELRLTPVLAGSATILLLGAGVDLFGFIPCLVAALLFVVGPLPVYYSRYFIHETLFVAATLGLILFGGRLFGWSAITPAVVAGAPAERPPAPRWGAAVGVGLCAALMLACKETAVLHFFALAVVLACAWFLPPRDHEPGLKAAVVALAVLVVAGVLLFTWFGRNWAVFGDLLPAASHFTARAGGEGHEKPFGYYFHLLDPMVVLFVVAIAGVYSAVFDVVTRTRKSHLLLVIYGLVIFLTYSGIPYKTPWLALNLWLPLALVCGFGVGAFWDHIATPSGRWIVAIAGAFLLGTLAVQTKLLAFDRPADEQNPFAYAHTSEDLLGLAPRLGELAHINHLPEPRVAVVAADAWPLPWYLRRFSQVGYWQPGQDIAPADFYLTTTDLSDPLKDRLKNFRPEFFGVRPGVLVTLWIPPGLKLAP